jgi:hypothetical protein
MSAIPRKNNRRHPGVRGKRPDLKKLKKEEAKERQSFYDSLSVKEKLEHLARQLKKVGGEAKRQRQKLQIIIDKPVSPKETEEIFGVDAEQSDEMVEAADPKKKMKAKDRRKAEQE